MNSTIIEGWIKLYENSEGANVLWLDSQNNYNESDNTLTERLEFLCGKCATVRYYACNKEFNTDNADEYLIRTIYGDISCDYGMEYSEYTGYLWTNEELKVGGHDLLNELYSCVGKYVLIVVDIDEQKEEIKRKEREIKRNKGILKELIASASNMGITLEEYIKFLNEE